MSVARPGARGSRKTKRINERERQLDKLYDRGLVRQEDARAQAEADAVTCPLCDRPVHPSNWGAHMAQYHAETVKDGVVIALIRTDGGTQSRAVINEAVVQEYRRWKCTTMALNTGWRTVFTASRPTGRCVTRPSRRMSNRARGATPFYVR